MGLTQRRMRMIARIIARGVLQPRIRWCVKTGGLSFGMLHEVGYIHGLWISTSTFLSDDPFISSMGWWFDTGDCACRQASQYINYREDMESLQHGSFIQVRWEAKHHTAFPKDGNGGNSYSQETRSINGLEVGSLCPARSRARISVDQRVCGYDKTH